MTDLVTTLVEYAIAHPWARGALFLAAVLLLSLLAAAIEVGHDTPSVRYGTATVIVALIASDYIGWVGAACFVALGGVIGLAQWFARRRSFV